LSSAELDKLLTVCLEDRTVTGVRDVAMLMILRVGLRRSEVVSLDLWDFDSNEGNLRVRSGKGNKDRLVWMPDAATDYICQWVKARGNQAKDSPLLLPVSKSKKVIFRRLSDQAVLKIMVGRGKQAGLESFTPHDFRRTFIGELLDSGVDIVTAQNLVGHASPITTSKYDRRGEAVKKRAVNNLRI
jgi:site-specific recombinase XerD